MQNPCTSHDISVGISPNFPKLMPLGCQGPFSLGNESEVRFWADSHFFSPKKINGLSRFSDFSSGKISGIFGHCISRMRNIRITKKITKKLRNGQYSFRGVVHTYQTDNKPNSLP